MRVMLVLRSSDKFSRKDVELIAPHILRWGVELYCLTDTPLNIEGVNEIPMTNKWPGWWARMEMYAPHMARYRPFLYVDLDTAILGDISELKPENEQMYIPLEDFYQRGKLATGLLWLPESGKTHQVWHRWAKHTPYNSRRMDYFLRRVVKPDVFWQQLTPKVVSFKPRGWLKDPGDAIAVCFHGKPSIREAADTIQWVKDYVG